MKLDALKKLMKPVEYNGQKFDKFKWIFEHEYKGIRVQIKVPDRVEDPVIFDENGEKLENIFDTVGRHGFTVSTRIKDYITWSFSPGLYDAVIALMRTNDKNEYYRVINYKGKLYIPTFYIFDIIYKYGEYVGDKSFMERRAILVDSVSSDNIFHISYFFRGDIDMVYKKAVKHVNVQGIIAKKVDSIYTPGLSPDWVRYRKKEG